MEGGWEAGADMCVFDLPPPRCYAANAIGAVPIFFVGASLCFFVACHSHATPSPLGASSSKPALSLSTDRVFVGWKREETEGKRGTVCVVPRVRPDAASPRAGTAGCASIEMGPRRRVTEGPLTPARVRVVLTTRGGEAGKAVDGSRPGTTPGASGGGGS